MRRFAILVAIYGICCVSWTTAAPLERPTGRLQRYDQGASPSPARRGRATPARYEAPRRRTIQQAEQVQYREAAPAFYPEDVAPGPIADGPVHEGPFTEEWTDGPPWDYQQGGFYDSYGDDGYGWGPAPGFWGRAEYVYWWVRGSDTPPLVTTSPNNTPQADAGVLPNATILFGNERLNSAGRSGGRFTLGYWFDSCDRIGIDTSVFFFGEANQQYSNQSDGSPILARPFFNVDSEAQDAQLLAFPDIVTGSVNASATSRVYGGDLNVRRVLFFDVWSRVDVLAGYRYFRLAEGLRINTNTVSTDPQGSVPVGTTFGIVDSFDTRNNFNGGQLGVNAQMINGCWTLDLLAKLAIGSMAQTVTINGSTVTTVPGSAPVDASGGILALGSNIGTHNRNRFAVMPEIGADLRYQITPLWRLNLGYSLLIATNVVRPGDQINLNVDPNQFPPSLGGTQPTFAFQDSDVWLQGINFGIECNF